MTRVTPELLAELEAVIDASRKALADSAHMGGPAIDAARKTLLGALEQAEKARECAEAELLGGCEQAGDMLRRVRWPL